MEQELTLSSKISIALEKSSDFESRIEKFSEKIDIFWNQEKRKKNLTNGSLLNFSSLSQVGDSLEIKAYFVEYKHFLFQRNMGENLLINPIGVSGIALQNKGHKGHFLVGRRSNSVTQYPEHYEFIPSGSIEVDAQKNGMVDYKKQLIKELKEESGLTEKNIKSVHELCLIYDKLDRVYDIGICVELKEAELSLNPELSEYKGISIQTSSSIEKTFSREDVVPTSKLLFQAFKMSSQKRK